MLTRQALTVTKRLARGFPIVAFTGPRQSGKTTLSKLAFPKKPYISLENPEELAFAKEDPKGFLARFPNGAIIDEAQRHTPLFSWLQGIVDTRKRMGDFVLTGSAQFDLAAGISQSLAGRVGRVELLPLSAAELRTAKLLPNSLEDMLFRGGYPALYDRPLQPHDWFANYIATYVERDVRQALNVRDLGQFQTFLKMCAARSGQLLNLASLGADCGITGVTAKHWLSVLQASYVVTLLAPHHANFGKRLVKMPKLYFLDVGLAAWLLGIRDAATLALHPLRGTLFETWVVGEFIKDAYNKGEPHGLNFWRDNVGHEVDLLYEQAGAMHVIEMKSGATVASDWARGLQWFSAMAQSTAIRPQIVFGGADSYTRVGTRYTSWRDVP